MAGSDSEGRGPRCIAILGPFQSGKTTLLEAILARTGAIARQGKVGDGNTVGDGSAEARAHGMSVECNIASTEFMGDRYSFIDCPGSVEFQHERGAVLAGVDAAIVVCEADEKKVPALQLILRDLEERGVPHMLFLNKIDRSEAHVLDVLQLLQRASRSPLVLRQLPIFENEVAVGFVDLALERAFIYREHAPSEVVEMPEGLREREDEARFSMLERLADHDDALMEQLLEDIEPPRDRIFDDLKRELREGQICPVLIGSAERGNGILRLMKALRHEVPGVEETAVRLGLAQDGDVAQVLKTFHTGHGGKLSVVRVLSGSFKEGDVVTGAKGEENRIAGILALMGQETRKADRAEAGDLVAFAKLDAVATGETVAKGRAAPPQLYAPEAAPAAMGLAIAARERKDEVRLTSALAKIIEEDPSFAFDHAPATGQWVLHGQGEMHLRVALARLAQRFGLAVASVPPRVGYLETIRKPVAKRGRHKKQTGGHGQFGDVMLEIQPRPRGAGFEFTDTITGGVVPKQYIPAVEAGVRDAMERGPLGFPVVDVGANLSDGSYHAVDSSEAAFRAAGRLAMSEALAEAEPVLLEPVMAVEFAVPSDATARLNGIISSRRGQILGFDARPGWEGWDVIEARIPQAELKDIIVELRSATAGVGTFTARFDHMAELTGRAAEEVVNASREAA
jgi:elongation factor G